jgi:hypothetical protein
MPTNTASRVEVSATVSEMRPAFAVQEQQDRPLTASFCVEARWHVEEIVTFVSPIGRLERPAKKLGLAAAVYLRSCNRSGTG